MRARVLRGLAGFIVAAGLVLAAVVTVFALRDWLAPDRGTWSEWTGGALTALAAVAVALWIVGALLSRHAHRTRRDTVGSFLTRAEQGRVLDAIREFEADTSGEIRVHLAERTGKDPAITAARVFESLGMTRTRERNGVLFYVSIRDRRLAVIGDRGIHAAVPSEFWATVVARVESCFAAGRFADGLVEGIAMAGKALASHFPHRADDVNELPDVISRGRHDDDVE